MARARGRALIGYSERHHVIPRCMSGGDGQENIANLTPEEHYVAHQLLIKMYPATRGLATAAVLMAKQCTGNKAYGWLRRRHAADLAVTMIGNKRGLNTKRSPDQRKRMSEAARNRTSPPLSPETRRKLSVAMSGRPKSAEAIEKTANANRGRRNTAEAIARMRAIHKGKVLSPEHRRKISESLKGDPRLRSSLGKPLSPERRAHLSALWKGRVFSPEHKAKISAAKSAYWAAQRRSTAEQKGGA